MGKQKIANRPELIEFLLNEQTPITVRLKEYNKYDCLAFITSPRMLYSKFCDLFKNNIEHQQAFEQAKKQSISEIKEKRNTLSYEDFLRYLFFNLERTGDHYGEQIIQTHENKNQNEPFTYNIVPINRNEAEILENIAVEHIKTKDGKGLGRNGARKLGKSSFALGYNSFETLKGKFNKSLEQPFADMEQVTTRYYDSFIKPLKNTEENSKIQRIYKNLKSGVIEDHEHSYYYGYYTTKAAIIELIKFEKFLITQPSQAIATPKNEISTPQPTETKTPESNFVKDISNNNEVLKSYAPYEKDFFDLTNYIELGKELFELRGDKELEVYRNQPIYKFWPDNFNEGIVLYHFDLALFFIGDIHARFSLDKETTLYAQTDKGKGIDLYMIKAYYVKGYLRGLEEWIKDYRLTTNQPITEAYLNQLHHLYFKARMTFDKCFFKIDKPFYGCSFVKQYFPKILSLKGIESIGYHSALTNNIDLFVEETGHYKVTQNEEKNNSYTPQSNTPTEQGETKKLIFEMFENMHDNGWQYAFKNEKDHNNFSNLLTDFFEYKKYTLPKNIIPLKKNCKTRFGKTLGDIHKELSNEPTLKGDTKFLQIVRTLNHFENEKDLYKVLTR